MPKISIIIPALNEEKSLPFTLESIKSQDFSDFEIIIADAGSTDKTAEITESYGGRVVKGGMPAVGRNAGAKAATGEWLLFLDADVYLSDKFLSFVVTEAEETHADIASCGIVPLSDKIIDQIMHATANAYINLTQYFDPHAPGFCILVKKSLHEKINGFDETLKLAEDHDYVKRAKEFGSYKILKKPKIYVSVRRMESDGRFNIAAKYVACEVYRALLGEIRTDLFKYKFGHHYDKLKDKIKNGL